jgi:acyl carrier protein
MAEELTWDHFITTVADSLGMETGELSASTHIYNDIGIDSLGMFSLGLKLIKVYAIQIPLGEVGTIQTLGDMYSAMDVRRGKKMV